MGFIMLSSRIINHKVKLFISSLFWVLTTLTFAQAPSGYYESTEGLVSYELKTTLKIIIDDVGDENGFPSHQDQGYGALYGAYAAENSGDSDDYFENDGTVLDMYSERILGIDNYNYEHFENNCGNYSNEGDCYNREHLVPQSTFNSASPMKNDYFHVVPSDGAVNGAQGSFPLEKSHIQITPLQMGLNEVQILSLVTQEQYLNLLTNSREILLGLSFTLLFDTKMNSILIGEQTKS